MKKLSIYDRIPNGGLPETIHIDDAQEYAALHIDMEMRDPNGLDRNAKVFMAMRKRIAELEAFIETHGIELPK